MTTENRELKICRLTDAGEEIELSADDLAEDELEMVARIFPEQFRELATRKACEAQKKIILRVFEARYPNCKEVKIRLAHNGECVFDRAPCLVPGARKLYGDPHSRYYTMSVTDFVAALARDVRRRPGAWGGAVHGCGAVLEWENPTPLRLQNALERFLEHFVTPGE